DFTYSVVDTNVGAGDFCSYLDSTPTCVGANPPTGGATSGAALLLLRCTSDAGGTLLALCASDNVYATQVYPLAGAGTKVHMGVAGLTSAASATVASAVITMHGAADMSFTGGQLL